MLAREQGEHAKAEACWRDATRTLLAMQQASISPISPYISLHLPYISRPLLRLQQGAQGGRGEAAAPREARAAEQQAAERLELRMCMADCLRCQGRFDESEVRAGAPLAKPRTPHPEPRTPNPEP